MNPRPLRGNPGDLATKQDIDRFSEKVEARFKWLQWMLGFNLALSTAALWAVIRAATH